MQWVLNILDKLGRKRIVMDRTDSEPYLERYYLFLKDRGSFPFNVFLHMILKAINYARWLFGEDPAVFVYLVLIAFTGLNLILL